MPIRYSIYGDGFPLIFLHGFNESSEIWVSILPKLSKHYQCIFIDLPGFGKSPLPAHLTLNYMAAGVHRIIEELSLRHPAIIGHSMGGYVLLELVNLYPQLFSGAGLFHSTAFADSDEKRLNRLKTLEFLNKNPVTTFLNLFVEGLFAPFNLNSRMVKEAEKIVHKVSKETVIAGISAMLDRYDRSELLKNVKMPWLFISGEHDQLIPMKPQSLQASYCNMALFEILNHSGHLGMIEEPDRSADIIISFMELVKNLQKD